MSEFVPDPQEGIGVPEPQVGMGRTRVQLAPISAAVPVLLGVFGLAPRLIGNHEAQAGPTVPAAAEDSAAPAPPEKRWRIEGHVEPPEGQGPIEVALLLRPLENGDWAAADGQGHFEFDVPAPGPGGYSLQVTSLDGSDIPVITVTVNKNPEEPVRSVLPLPAPFKVVTITEQ
jgi:hypothetical protein